MIREKSNGLPLQIEFEDVNINLEIRYNMGASQKFPVHIPTFLQRNQGDPAIKASEPVFFCCSLFDASTQNFYAKLREHLLPRVQTVLQKEVASCSDFN